MITSQLRRRRGAAVLIVDGARELRFPAQARAGTDTSGADVTFRFSNLFVGRPVRASTTRSPPLGGCKVERGGLGGSPARPPALERARGGRLRRSLVAELSAVAINRDGKTICGAREADQAHSGTPVARHRMPHGACGSCLQPELPTPPAQAGSHYSIYSCPSLYILQPRPVSGIRFVIV